MAGFVSRLESATRWFPVSMPLVERKLVRKLDWLVLPYACLSFFVKYLDVSALTNAYVSGMKQDLDLSGNRLNYINAAYEVGYVVFQIPSNMVLIKYPAQYYLPAAEIFWGLFTLGTAFVQTYEQLVVMRFFVGLSATSCYVGLVHVVNSWYRKEELGRRNALFWIANPIGQMFAGYLQAAAYTHLNNNHGLQGWRWLFIICTVITIPIALLGFLIFPDMPERTKSRFLNTEEKALANKRLQEEGFKPSTGLNKTIIKRIFTSWRFYAFVLLLVIFCNMTYSEATPFILWLDSQPDKYPVALVNNLSTVTNGAAVAGALMMSFYSDIRGSRTEPIILSGILCIFANLVLSIWNIPDGLKFFAYISVGWSYGTIPVLIAWTAEGLAGDSEVRALTLASYNCVGEITSLVVPLVAWPVSKAPGFRGGFIWATVLSVFYLFNVAWIVIKQKRSNKKITMAEEQGSGEEDTVVTDQLTIQGEVTKL
ncbi:Sucrose/H+ symporter, plant [Penicillium camemberti]|uniref:Sucrose/H+ symporter, plant n=1 Tax=Penicillium camemberti (strain FM 013) TaxID=1429867 RepID=A0A0G4P9W5_PENC3|nr:Sucrose/H+ symporter, plant [Penicillium camemberti]